MKGVSHVVNFDVPWQPDDYVHRIGRTGRAGAKGIAYTLATSADAEAVAAIEKLTGTKIPRVGDNKSVETDAGETQDAAAPEPEAKPARSRGRSRGKGKSDAPPAAEAASAAKAEAPKAAPPQPKREEPKRAEPAPVKVAEDADAEWNGPVPSFLSLSAL